MSRSDLIAQLANLPVEMRERRQWLVWRLIAKRGAAAGAKPAKVPFYVSGFPRGWPNGKPKDGKPTEAQPQVEQGHELDRAALVSFDQVLQVLDKQGQWSGVGFAFLPGDGLIGVDIDGAVDLETGEISRRCGLVIGMCQSYTERSVSGTGMHIVMSGDVEKFKSDEIGLEVYCRSQYFTCTGQHLPGTPTEVLPADPEALSIMRGMVEQALAQAKTVREAAAAEKAAAAAPTAPKPAPRPPSASSGASFAPGDDFKRVNEAALANLSAWVPVLFPAAKQHTSEKGVGYRVTSKDLGRKLQEDLAITPGGIKDFGEEQGKSPIDLVVQWGGKSLHDALIWLAALVGVTLAPKRASRPGASSGGQRPEPPDDGEPAGLDGPLNPPHPHLDENGGGARPDGGGGESADDAPDQTDGAKAGGKTKVKAALSKHVQENLLTLRESFAYQYGSEIAWDVPRRKPIKIAHLRHSYGGDAVKIWMASPTRRVVFEEQVVFEPGVEVDAECINLFAGLGVEPEKGDCSVMVELLHYLCSTSTAPGMGPEDIADWVLRWCALPLQRIGAKMDTALVFHGPQGTGKNLFFDVLRDLYGEYGVMVGQTEIEDKYNTWLSRKMLVVGDEVVSRQEMYHAKNRLKWVVTQKTKIPIRAMHMDTRWESNHVNLVFLSNESQPLALEDNDRRYMVVYTPTAERGDLYARVAEYLANNGAAKFLHFLQTLPLDDFEPNTKPPLTAAKTALIELGYKPAERFMHEWVGGYLPLPMRVCSVEQLFTVYKRWAESVGEKWFGSQAAFTDQANKYVRERVELDEDGAVREPILTKKEVQLKTELGAGAGRRQVRCWIPRGCGPRAVGDLEEFRTMGDWAQSAISEFETVARNFLRRDTASDGDERPEPP